MLVHSILLSDILSYNGVLIIIDSCMNRLLYKFGRLLTNIMIETEPIVKKMRIEETAVNGGGGVDATVVNGGGGAEATVVNGDAGADATAVLDRPKRIKELKYAMLMSYDGSNYYGMQSQGLGGLPTVEKCLLKSMFDLELITEDKMLKPILFNFQRAARTDRGVSACRQVCSMWLRVPPDDVATVASRMNGILPSDIRIMGVKRVTKNFHCQKKCDYRTYSYTLPTFAFADCDQVTTADFRLSTERRVEINELLHIYEGTHNFFNYTAGKTHKDASSQRYMRKVYCGEPFVHETPRGPMEFATILVKGNSFMLHQIRKMIGLMIAVIRGLADKSTIQKSWENIRIDVPIAPGLGLMLEQVHYESYDKKFEESHAPLDSWPECEATIAQFREEKILPHIFDGEAVDQSMMKWLSTLSFHQFATDPEAEEEPKRKVLPIDTDLVAGADDDVVAVEQMDDDDGDGAAGIDADDDDGEMPRISKSAEMI